jgi:hypothetical protein
MDSEVLTDPNNILFQVLHDPVRKTDTMIADFGESAIGRVAPVDSGFWWIILLRAYTKSTGDHSLADMPDCQRGMRLILTLCLSDGFDTFPTLLCADGCCMTDRRMVRSLDVSLLLRSKLKYLNIASFTYISIEVFHLSQFHLSSTIIYMHPEVEILVPME